MTIEQYIQMALSIAYVAGSIAGMIVAWIKAKKANDKAKEEAIKNNVKEQIKIFIQDAEQFKNYTPQERLMYVVTRAKCINQNVYSEDEIIDITNKEVEFTNNVNTPETKKAV